MNAGEFIAILGGWSVIIVGLSAFVGRLITNRLLSVWNSQQERKTEVLRSELEKSHSSLLKAIEAHAGSQGALYERRAKAAISLWQAVLRMRNELNFPLFFFGILLPAEYGSAIRDDSDLAGPAAQMTNQAVIDATSIAGEVEKDRPLLGEMIWLYFSAYRSFLGRLAILIATGRDAGHIGDWRDDTLINEILGTVLLSSDIESLLRGKGVFPSPRRAADKLESMILSELSRLLSGEISSLESFENTRKLRELEEDAERQKAR